MIRPFRRTVFAPLPLVVSGVLAVSAMTALATPAVAAVDDPPPVSDRTSSMFTTDPLPTAQINGVAFTSVVAGDTVYAAGKFSKGRPAGAAKGTQEVTRKNLIAIKASTGKMTSFAPQFDGTVHSLAVSDDKKTLYAGGEFTHVSLGTKKSSRAYFAAFDLTTGKLLSMNPKFNNRVQAVYSSGGVVYVGGWFTTAGGNVRKHIAALTSSGRLTAWAPVADRTPHAFVATPDKTKIIVGGEFTTLNGVGAVGMGALDVKTGATKTWLINEIVEDGGVGSAIDSLRTDGTNIYGSGYSYNGGNYEGTFAASPADGSPVWLQDCHGDSYDVVPVRGVLYSVSHAHSCKNIGAFRDTRATSLRYRSLAVTTTPEGTVQHNTATDKAYGDFYGLPAPSLYNWFPDLTAGTATGMEQAAWTIASSGDYLILAGEFPKVNGKAQQGLVRYTVPSGTTPRVRPTTPVAPKVGALSGTSATLSWTSSSDRDNLALTYELLRGSTVVATQKNSSPWWDPTSLTATDATLEAGSRYSYSVRVTDSDGNTRTGPSVAFYTPSAYVDQVRADGAEHEWRLDAGSGKTDRDQAGTAPLTFDPSHTDLGVTGAIRGDVNPGVSFDGDSSAVGGARTTATQSLGTASTIETWVKTTDGTGDLVRFRADGDSAGAYPRRLVLTGGKIAYTVTSSAGAAKKITSDATYDDGAWHHVVATQDGDRIALYVDGSLSKSITGASAVNRSGRYAVGVGVDGSMDEVATYTSALSAAQVAQHYSLGRG